MAEKNPDADVDCWNGEWENELQVNMNPVSGDFICTTLVVRGDLHLRGSLGNASSETTTFTNPIVLGNVTTGANGGTFVIDGNLNIPSGVIIGNIAGHSASASSATSCTSFINPLAGDVTGPAGATVVQAIHGVPVSSTIPTGGQALTYHLGQLVPAPAPAPVITPKPLLYSSFTTANAPGVLPTPVVVGALNGDIFMQDYWNATFWWKYNGVTWVMQTHVPKNSQGVVNILTPINPSAVTTPQNPPPGAVAGDTWTEIYPQGWYTYLNMAVGAWSVQSSFGLGYPKINTASINTLPQQVDISGSIGDASRDYQAVFIELGAGGGQVYSDQTPAGSFPPYSPAFTNATFLAYSDIPIGTSVTHNFYDGPSLSANLLATLTKKYVQVKFIDDSTGLPVPWLGVFDNYAYPFIIDSNGVKINDSAGASTYMSAAYPGLYINGGFSGNGFFQGLVDTSMVTMDIRVHQVLPFATVWTLSDPGTTIYLPLPPGTPYNVFVDWGDGSPVENLVYTSYPPTLPSHTYTLAGSYTVSITGNAQAWDCNVVGVGQVFITDILSYGSLNLTKLNFAYQSITTPTSIDTPQVGITDMSYMFANCPTANPDVSAWDMHLVQDASLMFFNAYAAAPDTSLWITSSLINAYGMFYNATTANPNTGGWKTSNITNMVAMFKGASMADPDTSLWNTSSVTTMAEMFMDNGSANPNTTAWNTIAVTDMSWMFANSVANPNVSSWDTSSVQDFSNMFKNNPNAIPDTTIWDVSSATSMYAMFAGAALAAPYTATWNTSAVTNMAQMFTGATLANPNTSAWNTAAVTDMSQMFQNATSANPDVHAWQMFNVGDISNMFNGATAATPHVGSWNLNPTLGGNSAALANVFNQCGFTQTDYSIALVKFQADTTANGVAWGNIPAHYNAPPSSAATAHSTLLITRGWLFTDLGPA